jgi:DNA replication protein DnaC
VLESDLQLECTAQATVKDGVAHCEMVNDYVSREIFEEILEGTEKTSTSSSPRLPTCPRLQQLRRGLLRHTGGDRAVAQVLAIVPTAGLDAVLVAVALALQILGRRLPTRPATTACACRAAPRRSAMRDLIVELKALRLHGMAGAWSDLVEQGANAGVDASRWLLEHLLEAESTDRAMRSVSHQMHSAKFRVHRYRAGFDFEASPVDRKLVHQLADLSFTEAAHNAVLVGGPGLARRTWPRPSACRASLDMAMRVRFYSTVDLVNALEQEKSQGRAGRIAASLLRMDLIIFEELGYRPFSQAGGALLFHLLSKLCEHTSVLITTNLTFAEWSSVCGDASSPRAR